MKGCYLTIDDSPCESTDSLTDYLASHNIPAVLFCTGGEYYDFGVRIGQGIENNPDPVVRAIEKGFVIGNHTYSHRRSSELGYEEIIKEIEQTEKLIDRAYKNAGHNRPLKLLRFPHLDRGCGGWIVDYDKGGEYKDILKKVFTDGLNVTLVPPTEEQKEKKIKVQEYLKREGFSAKAFQNITIDWYAETEAADSVDALYTFSTSDWMMNPAFTKSWPYKSLEELKNKMDTDPWLNDSSSAQLILAHDQCGIHATTVALIEYMRHKGFNFIRV